LGVCLMSLSVPPLPTRPAPSAARNIATLAVVITSPSSTQVAFLSSFADLGAPPVSAGGSRLPCQCPVMIQVVHAATFAHEAQSVSDACARACIHTETTIPTMRGTLILHGLHSHPPCVLPRVASLYTIVRHDLPPCRWSGIWFWNDHPVRGRGCFLFRRRRWRRLWGHRWWLWWWRRRSSPLGEPGAGAHRLRHVRIPAHVLSIRVTLLAVACAPGCRPRRVWVAAVGADTHLGAPARPAERLRMRPPTPPCPPWHPSSKRP
jgi:hypothetical protein